MRLHVCQLKGPTKMILSAAYFRCMWQSRSNERFVERVVGLNDTSEDHNTLLMLAAKNGKLEVVRYVTNMGADNNFRNANKYTALHFATTSDSGHMIKFLLKNECLMT
jgi:ankyrin repeat protein